MLTTAVHSHKQAEESWLQVQETQEQNLL